jgi:hypothetical protein
MSDCEGSQKAYLTERIEVLSDLFIERGVPVHIRSDEGPEFIAKRVRKWLGHYKFGHYLLNHAVPGEWVY